MPDDITVSLMLVIGASRRRQLQARADADHLIEELATTRMDQALDRWRLLVPRKTLAGQAPDKTH